MSVVRSMHTCTHMHQEKTRWSERDYDTFYWKQNIFPRGVIVQAHPLAASGSVYPTQHNTTHARTRTHACTEKEEERERESEKERKREKDARTHA